MTRGSKRKNQAEGFRMVNFARLEEGNLRGTWEQLKIIRGRKERDGLDGRCFSSTGKGERT